ncbi:MAG: tRNA (guanosine(46)-N7)-methyltransferase TrmB [Planctomycetota bacterium]|nr:tRNA (guanosine(46)-N7)-methyltransferase TrmB [Planctomycetota bacterium]
MPADEPRSRQIPRAQLGGKLSFRRRVLGIEDHPRLFIDSSENPPKLDSLVPKEAETVEIEVGPGKGAFMLAATEVNPQTFLLGIEAAPAYARYTAQRLDKAGRDKTLVLVDNARLYLRDRVSTGSLDRLHVYFPDPWPKRRHRKRRFFNADIAAIIHRALRPDGLLLTATDNAAYAGQIARLLGASDLLTRDESEEQRLIDLGTGHAFSPTNFEQKYLKEGRVIRRYAFRNA